MVTSSLATTELLYLAHEGDKEVSWSEVCSNFGKFCNREKNLTDSSFLGSSLLHLTLLPLLSWFFNLEALNNFTTRYC
ncbi:hypothetical protein KSP40_PGU018997 [Platanthera guangdongensis]|uniref:CASP-like protein n=1 Tax=Platanthera guangdongensis TaxID=2320717 RepID=A0ABR2MMY6_9ASPA